VTKSIDAVPLEWYNRPTRSKGGTIVSVRHRLIGAVAAILLMASAAIAAQNKGPREPQSAPLAAELTQLLDSMKLTNVAARIGDTFVGAYYIPGRQLLVVSGKFSADERIRYLIAMKQYEDAYVDLNGASDRETRVLISDIGADGLMFDRKKDEPFDYVTTGDASVQFDGAFGGRNRPSREKYTETWEQHDTQYAQMLQALIAVLKKSS
jgi:hypothetical protein